MLEDLLVHAIQDILSAEHKAKNALPRMAAAVGSHKLRKAFTHHHAETEAQIQRLEKAFELLGKPVAASHCEAAEGRMPEAEDHLDRAANRPLLDAGIVAAAQRFQHRKIAAYGSAISFARQLNRHEVASLLLESLNEETAAENELVSIAEDVVSVPGRTRHWLGRR